MNFRICILYIFPTDPLCPTPSAHADLALLRELFKMEGVTGTFYFRGEP